MNPVLMSLERSESTRTMVSRAWTTSDFSKGLEHLLLDANAPLPDDLDQLEALDVVAPAIELVRHNK